MGNRHISVMKQSRSPRQGFPSSELELELEDLTLGGYVIGGGKNGSTTIQFL